MHPVCVSSFSFICEIKRKWVFSRETEETSPHSASFSLIRYWLDQSKSTIVLALTFDLWPWWSLNHPNLTNVFCFGETEKDLSLFIGFFLALCSISHVRSSAARWRHDAGPAASYQSQPDRDFSRSVAPLWSWSSVYFGLFHPRTVLNGRIPDWTCSLKLQSNR